MCSFMHEYGCNLTYVHVRPAHLAHVEHAHTQLGIARAVGNGDFRHQAERSRAMRTKVYSRALSLSAN